MQNEHELELSRSDLGCGGWSLGYEREDGRYVIVASGEAALIDGRWSRPNEDDYRAARAALRPAP